MYVTFKNDSKTSKSVITIENRSYVINPLSVKCLIDEVYEKHYARYSHLFGNVIAGFFSD